MASNLPPGPNYPGLLATLKWIRDVVNLLETGHERYGDLWTLRLMGGATFVFVSDPKLLEGIFTADQDVLLNEARLATSLLGEHSVLVLGGAEHEATRRILQPLFHRERVQRHHDDVARFAEQELAEWPLNEPISLVPHLRTITLNVMMTMIFGAPLGEPQEALRARMQELLTWLSNTRHMALYQAKFMRGWAPPRAFVRVRSPVDDLLYKEIARARKDPRLEERDDVLAMLIRARYEDGRAMSDQELRDHLITLLIQGHESTANALAWVFERVLRHPEVEERLRDEVRTENDEYLDAVVKETLRIRPPLPFPMRRVVNQPYRLREYELEPETMITINIYIVHRREDEYPEPDQFRPERFLTEPPPSKYAWIPFGGGVRGCFGAEHALSEMKIILQTLFQQARLAPAEQRDETIIRRGIGFSPSEGGRVVVTERIPAAARAQAVA